jgi:transposase
MFMVRRSYNRISNKNREKILSKIKQGVSTKAISDALELNYWTVLKIVNNYQLSGHTNTKKLGGDRCSKLDNVKKNQIRKWVDKNCLLTLREISQKIFDSYGLDVSQSTVDRCLRSFHYTLKAISLVPAPRNTESTILKRLEYAQKFRNYEVSHNSERLVFLDEVGFAVSSRPKKGRSLQGTSSYVDVPAARTRNISVLAAMNKNGMVFNKVYDKALNGEDFKSSLVLLKQKCEILGILNPIFFYG